MSNEIKLGRQELKGDAVGGGIVTGKTYIFGSKSITIPRTWIKATQIPAEIKRFNQALEDCKAELLRLQSKICRIQGREEITILDSHILLLQDELLRRNTVHNIEQNFINAEWALKIALDEIKSAFSKMNQPYLQERKYDIDFIGNALEHNLMGLAQDFLKNVPREAIIIANNLSPAQILHLIRSHIAGFALETGGSNSHTAIVARSLGIPALMGVDGLMNKITQNQTAILNAKKGVLILSPSETEIEKNKSLRNQKLRDEKIIRRESRGEAMTTDGRKINILANMELLDEMEFIENNGAEGIGLYRTEFLFLDRSSAPSVEEQAQVYRTILKRFKPHPVIIRTLDLGAEKMFQATEAQLSQANPVMGLRAVRLCLQEKRMFMDQLTALLMASTEDNLKICIPMVTSMEEMILVKKMLEESKENLRKKEIPFNPNVLIGPMLETPGAILVADWLATESDFFSVGTNDLTQYTLAVDRTNDLVSHLYQPLHPAMLRSLQSVCHIAAKFEKEITICGEIAADPLYLLVLIGMGYTHLSMNAASIPRIKSMIRKCSFSKSAALVEKIMSFSSHKQAHKFLTQRMQESFPEFFQ